MAKERDPIPAQELQTPLLNQKVVIKWWVEQSPLKDACHPEELKKFTQLLDFSQVKQQPITFIVMGCHDWNKPSWGNSEKDRLIGTISQSGKRVQRFAQEFNTFQKAIKSLTNIDHNFLLSISDVESTMHDKLKNMGLVIHNVNLSNMLESNLKELSQAITNNDGSVTPFSHLEVIQEIMQTNDLKKIQQQLSTDPQNPHFTDFLEKLYEFDIQHLLNFFSTPNDVGKVWLDLISTDYAQDKEIFRNLKNQHNPDLILLNPFKNNGNWGSRPSPFNLFPTKLDMISQALNINSTLSVKEWFHKAHQAPDKKVANLLAELNISVTIHNRNTKTDAVNKLIKIAF